MSPSEAPQGPDERVPGSTLDAPAALERLGSLPLEERSGALAETVRRLEAELDATEARPEARPAGN